MAALRQEHSFSTIHDVALQAAHDLANAEKNTEQCIFSIDKKIPIAQTEQNRTDSSQVFANAKKTETETTELTPDPSIEDPLKLGSSVSVSVQKKNDDETLEAGQGNQNESAFYYRPSPQLKIEQQKREDAYKAREDVFIKKPKADVQPVVKNASAAVSRPVSTRVCGAAMVTGHENDHRLIFADKLADLVRGDPQLEGPMGLACAQLASIGIEVWSIAYAIELWRGRSRPNKARYLVGIARNQQNQSRIRTLS